MEPSPHNVSHAVTADLLAHIAKGEEQAFRVLYDLSSSLLFTLAVRILRNRDEAADLLQEIYLEIWRKTARYDAARGAPLAWLVTLTRGRAVDRLRARATPGHASADSGGPTSVPLPPTSSPSAPRTSADLARQDTVRKALAELPEAQRQAVELGFYDGLFHAEIAHRLGQPLDTINTRIKLAMSKLKVTFGSSWEQN